MFVIKYYLFDLLQYLLLYYFNFIDFVFLLVIIISFVIIVRIFILVFNYLVIIFLLKVKNLLNDQIQIQTYIYVHFNK